MGTVELLTTFDHIKLLSDARRLAILRRLMAKPATLTHLGEALGEHPAWVRHHLKKLEEAGLVEISEVRLTSGVTEKFYRARANAFVLREMILPVNPAHPLIILCGSHDLALEHLAKQLASELDLLTLPVGSLDGLVALRQGSCHLAGAHLFDQPSGEYNAPYVRHILPDSAPRIITLAHREQGLMSAPGNPLQIRDLSDLTRPDITFVNRQRGSGTRLWLDRQLQALGIPASQIRGYEHEVRTHTESAQAVQRHQAEAALGLGASARQHGLDFLPLFHERYDLVLPQDGTGALQPLLDALQTREFRRGVDSLSGYDTTHTGEQIIL